MNLDQTEAFLLWLDKQLAEKNMTDNQLAKKAGLGHSSISKARKGSLPGFKGCISIARALNVSEIEVLRAAGHISTPPDYDPDLERLLWACEYQLPKRKRKEGYRVIMGMSIEDDLPDKSE
jgi:transcriptional regulator with XRE-family HTH domain